MNRGKSENQNHSFLSIELINRRYRNSGNVPDEMFYGQEPIRSAFNRTFARRGFIENSVTSAISRLKLHWFRISWRISINHANTPVSASALVQIGNNKCVWRYIPIFTVVWLKICGEERKRDSIVQHIVYIVPTLSTVYEFCKLILAKYYIAKRDK